MSSIVRTEWLKIRKYPAFWWMTGIVALAYPGINYMLYYNAYLQQMDNPTVGPILKMLANPFTFPEAWHTIAYISTYFVFIPSIVVIMFISNEYTYKTHRQNIIDGWSRSKFMMSKMIDVFLISILATILYFLVALFIGYSNISTSTGSVWSQTQYIGLFFLQTFSQLSIAFLVAFLVRKAFIALGIFLFYFFPLEPIMVGWLQHKNYAVAEYFPLSISNRMIPVPRFLIRNETRWRELIDAINPHIFYTIIFTALVWGLCFWINSKRDL